MNNPIEILAWVDARTTDPERIVSEVLELLADQIEVFGLHTPVVLRVQQNRQEIYRHSNTLAEVIEHLIDWGYGTSEAIL
ncbi:hypothetical protein ACFQRD_16690 [Brachybacterium sp. GCM10030268]|uniref:hypothetical protein n=1 Tax=Brachybacterium sp. GCM10030268 TaxID=3273382 RepID=UPI00361934A9